MTGVSVQLIREIIALSQNGYMLSLMGEEESRQSVLQKSPKLLQVIARDLQIGLNELVGLVTFFHSPDKTGTLFHQAFLAFLFKLSGIYFLQDKKENLLTLRLAMSKNPFERLYIIEHYPHLIEPLAHRLRTHEQARIDNLKAKQ